MSHDVQKHYPRNIWTGHITETPALLARGLSVAIEKIQDGRQIFVPLFGTTDMEV